jgi:predicted membrane protein
MCDFVTTIILSFLVLFFTFSLFVNLYLNIRGDYPESISNLIYFIIHIVIVFIFGGLAILLSLLLYPYYWIKEKMKK